MIEVSLSLIGRDVAKISPKLRLDWDMRQTVDSLIRLRINLASYHLEMDLGHLSREKSRVVQARTQKSSPVTVKNRLTIDRLL